MDAIVMDAKSIYIINISENANRDDVLSAYMETSGEGWRDTQGMQYTYWTTSHSKVLYSIRRASTQSQKDDGFLYSLIGEADIAGWWASVYPIIEQIATVTGAVTGVAAMIAAPFAFVKWVRSIIKTKNTNEYKGIKNILVSDTWNFSLLAEQLSISEEQAKNLLRGLGYEWNSHTMLYTATDNTRLLREKEAAVNYH